MEYVSKLFTFLYNGIVALKNSISDFLCDVFYDEEAESNPLSCNTVELDVLGVTPPLVPDPVPCNNGELTPGNPDTTSRLDVVPEHTEHLKDGDPLQETDDSDVGALADEDDEKRSNISDESFEFVDSDIG
jgi:hypothetical protein